MIITDSPGWDPNGWSSTDSPGFVDPGCALTVTLGGLVFSTGADRPQGSGFLLSLHRIVGWDESADDRTSTWGHWSGDGDSAGRLRWGVREVALEGMVLGTVGYGLGSPSEAHTAIMRKRSSTLRVSEVNGLTLEADVRIKSLQMTRRRGWPKWADFTLSLVADDPLRYGSGERSLSNGTVSLPNRGDQMAWPVLESSGPHGELSITHPGGTWTVPALDAGLRRTYDFRHGRTYNTSGQRIWGSHTGSGPRPRVEAQGWTDWTISGKGSGSLTLRRFEAWS